MSGISYESILQTIRNAPFVGAAADDPAVAPATASARMEDLFRAAPADSAETAPVRDELPPPLFDLRLARLASGWGGLVGLAAGAWAGSTSGLVGFVLGIAAGCLMGSLAGIAVLGLFAAMTHRLGPGWALIGSGLAVALVAAAAW